MEWWTHLWLNEGFANWIEYLSVDQVYPEYNIWTSFLINENITALSLDGLANSHPVEVQEYFDVGMEIMESVKNCLLPLLLLFSGPCWCSI